MVRAVTDLYARCGRCPRSRTARATASRRRRWTSTLAAFVLVASGCDHGRTYTTLATAVRVEELVPEAQTPGVVTGLDVRLGREVRRTIAAAATGAALARLDGTSPLRRYIVYDVTPAMREWGQVALTRTIDVGGRKQPPW